MKRDNDWIWIICILMVVVIAIAVNTWNRVQVCKSQDVYWVNGTQYTCKLFK